MKKQFSKVTVSMVMLLIALSSASAADLKKGKKVFNKCKACHTLVENKHRIGPSLHGIYGRKAGVASKYRFSRAMKNAGNSGLVWDDKSLAKYLSKPRSFIKGTKMAFAGIKKPRDMENLLAFLKEASK
ncbi:MAG: cytochrome C [Alphaproteobacteria bacterium]|nr:cytochrome C [Alphaproteobacteria bacterium]